MAAQCPDLEKSYSSSDSDVDVLGDGPRGGTPAFYGGPPAARLAGVALAAAALVCLAVSHAGRGPGPVPGAPHAAVTLDTTYATATSPGVPTGVPASAATQELAPAGAISAYGTPPAAPAAPLAAASAVAPTQAAQTVAAPVRKAVRVNSSLAPAETLSDGNVCADDEELHDGVCYSTCASLTNNRYQFRQSAWVCCRKAVCGFMEMNCCKHNFGFCSGFDVAGYQESKGGCPHKPGACLKDEELYFDVCYKKCNLLTRGAYPFRVAAETCCKKKDASCMIEDGLKDGMNGQSLTNVSFNVGGGCSDNNPNTHCQPHQPQQALTEA